MTLQGIKAYNIAVELINQEAATNLAEGPMGAKYTKEELKDALQALASASNRVEKILPKFNPGTSQHTLAIRRIKAFHIATELIQRELD